jgi:Flp pilus assembly protein CpaB
VTLTSTTVGERNGSGPSRRPVAKVRRRMSRGHWVALAAGSLAGLFTFAALRDRSETVTVAVAREAIPVAAALTPSMVRWEEVPASSPVADGLLNRASFGEGELLAVRSIAEGEPVTAMAVSFDVPTGGMRSMSVPIAREHAANGAIVRGDRVDVIDLVAGQAMFVVTGAEVIAVGGESGGSVTERPAQFAVTLAVDAESALRITEALADDELEIVRSTGATPVAAEAGDG